MYQERLKEISYAYWTESWGRVDRTPVNPAPIPKKHKETDWKQIKQRVQMRELPKEQVPRLLFEAIQEIGRLQEQLRSLREQIQKLYDHSKSD